MTRKLKKRVAEILIVLIFLLPEVAFSQMFLGFSNESNKLKNSYDEIEDLQIQVANKLRRYFDQNKFMVVVDVEERERTMPTTGALPDLLTVDTGMSIDYLPGLPFHPSIRKKSMEIAPKRSFAGQLQKYYRHTIQVLMDTSYSQTALKFAEEVIRGSGLMNIKDGDEVFIEFQAFPNKYPGLVGENGNEPMPEAIDPDTKTPSIEDFEQMLDKKLNKPKEVQEKEQREGQWIMWLLVGLVSLLLLMYILQMVFASLKQRRETRRVVKQGELVESEKVSSLQNQIQKLTETINKPLNSELEIDELANLAAL